METNVPEEIKIPNPPKKKNKRQIILLILALIVLAAAILLALKNMGYFNKPQPKEEPKAQETITPKTLLSGSVKLLSDKLGLIDKAVWGEYYSYDDFIYYEAGTYNSGAYKDYKRIIALEQPMGPGGASVKVFITNDYKTYILDGDPSMVGKYPTNDWQNPLYGINRNKVVKVEKIESEHPDQVKMDDRFVLHRGQIPVDNVAPVKEGGDWTWELSKYKNYEETKNDFGDLKLFTTKGYKKSDNYDKFEAEGKAKEDLLAQNIDGRSSVIMVDSTGLPYRYFIGDKTATISTIKANDIAGASGLYQSYSYAFPGACYGQSDTAIAKGITDSDLEKIGSIAGGTIDIYKLKSTKSQLLQIAYDQKTSFMYTGDYRQPYTVTSQSDLRPSFEEYVKKNPLIFFKDPLGRWEMFVEYQYLMPGGCGKPVIYLYPTKPTEVSVSFGKEMLLARDIPSYSDGWKVLANPNGTLKDLQPSKTDCSKINSSEKGMEYASSACKNNSYPYIYWAGDVMNSAYPLTNQGWAVAKADLEKFLDAKLSYIGLNGKEKGDMLEYWVPEMLAKNAPYYRVSFFQNSTMDRFIPMNITPTPDSIGRVFLDWAPLKEKININPQKLLPIERNGFTVIEWGGIKK